VSVWKELPKPATPGPWVDAGPDIIKPGHLPIPVVEVRRANKQDLHAIAALPEYVAEVERLRAWVDWMTARPDDRMGDVSQRLMWVPAVRGGEWPEGGGPMTDPRPTPPERVPFGGASREARQKAIKDAAEQVRTAETPFLRRATPPERVPVEVVRWRRAALSTDGGAVYEAGDALAAALGATAAERDWLAEDLRKALACGKDLLRQVGDLRAERDRALATLRELEEAANRAVRDLSHDAVIGAPFVARIARERLENP
jgi:hypothetical protein